MSMSTAAPSSAHEYGPLRLYIGGTWHDAAGRRVQPVHNPADGSVLGELPHASVADLDAALAAAEQAFATWRRSSPTDRAAVLHKAAALLRERAPEIGHGIALDQGKPLPEAVMEVRVSADHVDWHAEECRRIYGRVVPSRMGNVRQLVLREPVGVCAAFTPWNYPALQAARKIAAAIGAGCTMVLKGPEDTPSAIVALARAFEDAGLPKGCLNIVWGVPHEVSEHLLASPIVRKVSFTGSVAVGKQLGALAASRMQRSTLELGGHSPALVFGDADVEQAADLLAASKFRNAGQICASPSRMYVQASVFERFVDRFVAAARAIKVAPAFEPGARMGPLMHARRVQAMQELVGDAVDHGARVLLGGEPLPGPGHFFAPTVLTDVPEEARMMNVEPFGPVAPICRFESADEALARANRLPYGLAAYAFTGSGRTAARMAAEIESGMVSINQTGLPWPEIPFGGVKDSGHGSEGGSETFDGYLVTKFVTQLD